MAKRKVGQPKQSNNNMGVQSGVNLTGATVSSQSCELETSSVTDHDATTTPPPAGGGSKTGAQASPSTSDVKLEYNIVLPDKGKGKAVPDNTVQGGSGMTLLENGKERLVSRDETKVMIAHNHAQYVTIQQEDQMMKTPGMN